MAKTFLLSIVTPYGRYLETQVEFLECRNDQYSMGILAGHAPLIATISISKIKIRISDKTFIYACGGGMIEINKEKVTLVLNSIERSDEIDIERAKQAKQRAENRLNNQDETIDITRAKAALMRAIIRIDVSENN